MSKDAPTSMPFWNSAPWKTWLILWGACSLRNLLSASINIFQITAVGLGTFLKRFAAAVRSLSAGKRGFHNVRGPQISPMLFGVLIESHHPLPVPFQGHLGR